MTERKCCINHYLSELFHVHWRPAIVSLIKEQNYFYGSLQLLLR